MAKRRKSGRKKPRSAKQKAATRKLVRSNRKTPKSRSKSRSRRKTKAKSRRTNKRSKPRKKSMAGRKGLSKLTSNPTLRKVLMAAGAVSVATSVAALVFPSIVPTLQSPIVRAGLGFVAGDFIGAASNFVIGGGVQSLTGGGSNGNGTQQAGFGFA